MARWHGGTVVRWHGGTVARWHGGTVARWHGGVVVVRWTSDLKVGGLRPGPCHRVVSLDKKLYPTLSLSTQLRSCGPPMLVCDFKYLPFSKENLRRCRTMDYRRYNTVVVIKIIHLKIKL